jgi:hypothetical protein
LTDSPTTNENIQKPLDEINKKPENKPEATSNIDSEYEFYIDKSCGFDDAIFDKKVYSFSSDIEASNALDKIMKLTGLPANFEIKAASVDNACAVVKCDDYGNCDRYILYNQEFMEKIKDETQTSFSEIAILAHEIAHHLSGHTLGSTGSSHDMELEADKYAGFILFKLGAPLKDAKLAFSTLSIEGSSTHPPRAARIAAVTNGWFEAKRNGESSISSSANPIEGTGSSKGSSNNPNAMLEESEYFVSGENKASWVNWMTSYYSDRKFSEHYDADKFHSFYKMNPNLALDVKIGYCKLVPENIDSWAVIQHSGKKRVAQVGDYYNCKLVHYVEFIPFSSSMSNKSQKLKAEAYFDNDGNLMHIYFKPN